jgi:hypothetical protein
MTASALHTPRIETEILLPDNAKRIELCDTVQVDLLYAKQASYFAYPWALSNPTFRYDIANGWVNPAKDLLEGACSEWFSIQHLVHRFIKTFTESVGGVSLGAWPENPNFHPWSLAQRKSNAWQLWVPRARHRSAKSNGRGFFCSTSGVTIPRLSSEP